MQVTRKQVVGAAVAFVVAAGSGAALAVNRSSPAPAAERDAFLADVAQRLNVSEEELREAFRAARAERAPGEGRFGHPGGRWHHRGPAGGLLDAAAEYLGLDRAELRERLRSGSSLADVARAEGKSVDGLKDALRESFAAKLDARLDALVERTFPGKP